MSWVNNGSALAILGLFLHLPPTRERGREKDGVERVLGSTRLWLGYVACGLLCGSLLAVLLTSKENGKREECEG